MSINWTRLPDKEIIWAVLLSIMGASALASTGLIRLFFWPVNALIPTILAFADPCFPGLDFSNSTIRQGSPSMMTYWPILRLPTSTGLLMMSTREQILHLKDFVRKAILSLANSFQARHFSPKPTDRHAETDRSSREDRIPRSDQHGEETAPDNNCTRNDSRSRTSARNRGKTRNRQPSQENDRGSNGHSRGRRHSSQGRPRDASVEDADSCGQPWQERVSDRGRAGTGRRVV